MLASMRVEYDLECRLESGVGWTKKLLGDWVWFGCLWNSLFDSPVKEMKWRVLVKTKRCLCKSEDLCLRGVVPLPKFFLTLKINDSMVLRIVAHLILSNYKLRRKS